MSGKLRYETALPAQLEAPVAEGQEIGSLSVYAGDELLQTIPLRSDHAVARAGVWQRFLTLLGALV